MTRPTPRKAAETYWHNLQTIQQTPMPLGYYYNKTKHEHPKEIAEAIAKAEAQGRYPKYYKK
jgi:hypothetical protein